MPSVQEKKLATQLLDAAQPKEKLVLDWRNYLFAPQLAFVLDDSRQQTAVCTRRAGKTYGCGAKLLRAAMRKPGSVALYLTLSRKNSKFIVWEPLKQLIRHIGLPCKVNEGDLTVTFTNGSRVQISGVNDSTKVDDFRGLPYSLVLIDEAQSFPTYLQKLIDEAIAPGLMDYAGSLAMIGTPGPVPVGYFWDATISKSWSNHTWTAFDNPFIKQKSGKTAQQHLEDELNRRGVKITDAVIQREWFGKWVYDSDSLVFKWDNDRNGLNSLEGLITNQYVIGIDLGFDDADAIAVLGWSDESSNLYLVNELVVPHQGITELAAQIQERMEIYNPLRIVMDMGGLGKKIAEEIIKRTSIPVEAAEKVRKHEHIELLNDHLRLGKFKALKTSRFANDCMKVEWDRSNPVKPEVNDAKFHSDINDAVLYAFRQAQHYLFKPAPKPTPRPYTQAWYEMRAAEMKEQSEKIERRAIAKLDKKKSDREFWNDNWEDAVILDWQFSEEDL